MHGAHEPLAFRNRLFRFLVERMGFTAIALESGFTESISARSFIEGGEGDAETAARTGLSSWANRYLENRELIQWMRDYNVAASSAGHRRIRLYGIDITAGARKNGPWLAIDSALTFLPRADPKAALEMTASIPSSATMRLQVDYLPHIRSPVPQPRPQPVIHQLRLPTPRQPFVSRGKLAMRLRSESHTSGLTNGPLEHLLERRCQEMKLTEMIATVVIALGVLAVWPAMADDGLVPMSAWQLPATPSEDRWLEVHQIEGVGANMLFHVSVLSREKGHPVWSLKHVVPHMAITEAALRRSVTGPAPKQRMSYPEQYNEGYINGASCELRATRRSAKHRCLNARAFDREQTDGRFIGQCRGERSRLPD